MKEVPQVTVGFSTIWFPAELYKVGVKFNPCTLIENGIPSSQLLPEDFTCSAQSQMENSEKILFGGCPLRLVWWSLQGFLEGIFANLAGGTYHSWISLLRNWSVSFNE